MKPTVLFVTPTLGEKAACGVGLYGKLWSDALVDLDSCNFRVMYTDSTEQTVEVIRLLQPAVVIYMWHPGASNWMADPVFRNTFPHIKHVSVHHDILQETVDNFSPEVHNGGIPYAITANPTIRGNDRVFVTTKLLPPAPTVEYVEPPVPVIGYQGFAFPHKGIARLAYTINQEFDECLFRLHMPPSWFIDRNGHMIYDRTEEIKQYITKPGIRVEISSHMMDTQELVNWLAQNTINCYFYNYPDPAGLASAPDYAIAARRPIAVSRNHMLRHFEVCSPGVIINEPYSLRQIIANGFAPVETLHHAYSKENFLQDWSRIITHIISLN